MQNNLRFFRQQGRRPRAWVSYYAYGCLYDSIVCVVYRCPVIDGVPQLQLGWQHHVVPAA